MHSVVLPPESSTFFGGVATASGGIAARFCRITSYDSNGLWRLPFLYKKGRGLSTPDRFGPPGQGRAGVGNPHRRRQATSLPEASCLWISSPNHQVRRQQLDRKEDCSRERLARVRCHPARTPLRQRLPCPSRPRPAQPAHNGTAGTGLCGRRCLVGYPARSTRGAPPNPGGRAPD